MTNQDIALKLNKQQALVFFEWLARVETLEPSIFQHPGEEKVLWKLQSQLESALVEPFAANYEDILTEARRSVETDM
jgi:hypothetical protein